jgi:hypothetical protein
MKDAPNTVPVVSIVGKGDSGKTTFSRSSSRAHLARRSRGDRQAPRARLRHRHARQGLVAPRQGRSGDTMVSSPEKFSLIRETERELTLPELARVAYDTAATSCSPRATSAKASIASIVESLCARAWRSTEQPSAGVRGDVRARDRRRGAVEVRFRRPRPASGSTTLRLVADLDRRTRFSLGGER